MNKLKMQTPNPVNKNVEQIAGLFPEVITEIKDKEGNLVKGIDFDLLKQKLSSVLVEEDNERYRLDWPGKKASLLKANTPITKTLRPVVQESVNFDKTENLHIEGDNFEVLKILQESYLGKIKMIYIDPPYNTGSDFIYKDNFKKSNDEYEEEIGLFNDEGGRLFKNTDANGRFHSDWLSMIYERLIVARDLLSEDGVILISIDDNEVHNLRKLCDDVFDEGNFIAEIIRNTNSTKNQSLFVSVSHENCLIYSKNISFLERKHSNNKWSVKKNNIDEYIKKVNELKNLGSTDDEITEELKTLTKYPRFIDFTNYWYFDDRGLYQKGDLGGVNKGNVTPIINPITGKYDPVPPGGFRYKNEELQRLIAENRIHFHEDGSLPRIKRYLNENLTQRPRSIMSDDQRPDSALMTEFNTPFDNPKQLAFIMRILSVCDKDSIVLDFFAGSSTTAHAVLALNAEDGGNRKFIMIQISEETTEDSEAYKAGYRDISEISRERIRRAGKKILGEYAEIIANRNIPLDIGFRVFKIDSSNMKDVFYHPTDINQEQLSTFVSNIKEDRTPEDLLIQVMLDLGLELSLSIDNREILGNSVFVVQENALVACFDDNINFGIVDVIADLKPFKVVFKDASFADDKDRINVEERFKRLSPETVITVI